MTLQAKDWRRQGGADQNELEDGVDLADGGRLDLSGGQGHVEVLLNAELQCNGGSDGLTHLTVTVSQYNNLIGSVYIQ